MENNSTFRRPLGRPRKESKKDILLAVMASQSDKGIIEAQARKANLCISVYLREMGIHGAIHVKEYDRELLKFLANLSNIGSLLNQLAKKRNSSNDLNAIERAELNVLANDIANLIDTIKATIK
jgi:hypothetical protein